MPVTTSTYIGEFESCARVWVHADGGPYGSPQGYLVTLAWDPEHFGFASAGSTGPAPTMVNAGAGIAVWRDVNLSSNQDFEILLVCAEDAEGSTRIDGAAMKPASLEAHKSSAFWECS